MWFWKFVASGCGVGYAGRGSGTWASMVTALFLWLATRWFPGMEAHWPWLALGLTSIGVIASQKVQHIWGKDPQCVVIDEAAGMAIGLCWVPLTGVHYVLALIIFRLLDIYKPFYIKNLERFPGGFGVMADDVLAGIYTSLIVQTGSWLAVQGLN
ncbi:MAG: phosphatidylglycerophosphatase A [Saprospiraceae bacterium]|nr:phosphatidylglycerophosphatase A [Saprospiraceae bacterium]